MASKGVTIFITGAAGYVGAALSDQLSKRSDVAYVIALDRDPKPALLEGNEKVVWYMANTADTSWQDDVRRHHPDVVIHCAWEIREMYGKRKLQWHWNVEGSLNVFSFAFTTPSVKRLIHFSTAAVYGASPANTIEHRFLENEPLRETEYSYGSEKRFVEKALRKRFEEGERKSDKIPVVSIVRPAAITGPRGRFMRLRFGLQSALSGRLPPTFLNRIVSLLVSFVPATALWCRQFVHEDDVVDIVTALALGDNSKSFSVFNLAPQGEVVRAGHMAAAVAKKVLPVTPFMIRLGYFFAWHLTRGRIPTAPGVWRFYSYPIVLNGSKVTRELGIKYQFQSLEAFQSPRGRYERFVPEHKRRA